MSFSRNDYLHWYIPRMSRRDKAINLHSSGVASLEEHSIAPAAGHPWSMTERFEASLCALLGLPPQELLWAPGATGGTLLALLGLTSPGDEVLVESPIYEPMLRQAERTCTVQRLHRDYATGFVLPLDQAEALIGPRTRLVLLTEPSNPSGTCAPADQVLALADLAARHGATLLINEVYRGFTQQPSYHGQRPNIVIVSSFSKLLGAYWMRLGWLSGPADLVARLRSAHFTFGAPAQPCAAYGISLCERYESLRLEAQSLSAQGTRLVDDWVKATPGVSWHTPQGPGFGCLQLPPHLANDIAFAEALHDRDGVLAVPGAFFELPGSLRLCWLQAGDRLPEGLDRLARALQSAEASRMERSL